MAELWEIQNGVEELLVHLQELTRIQEHICRGTIAADVAVGTYPVQAELEEIRRKSEQLRQELQELSKQRGKLDPQVRELDRKLDEALSRYYWLWQKCKSNM